MLSERKIMKQFGNPLFLREPPPPSLSTNPLPLSNFFMTPLFCPNFKNMKNPLILEEMKLWKDCGWLLISERSVENCISVVRLNDSDIDLQSILQNINKFAASQTRPILTNTRSSHSPALSIWCVQSHAHTPAHAALVWCV